MKQEIPSQYAKTARRFADDIGGAFGDSLVSVILYGAALRGDVARGKQPLQFLVVVADNTPSELVKVHRHLKRWRKDGIGLPLFLTPEYIDSSLDSFPLEFMNMAGGYAVVTGDDVLENLAFDAADVRGQCEREIKGKLLHLRAEYLELRGNTKGVIDLVHRSIMTFRLVFAGALYLRGCEIPVRTRDMLESVCGEYGLDGGLFDKLITVAEGGTLPGDTETDRLFDRYVEELDTLSDHIDAAGTDTPDSGQQSGGTTED